MYTEFYNFSEKPFDTTSNPRFLYFTPVYKEVLASLIYGIQERRGILAVFGEVGTGKTTILKAAIEQLKNTVDFAFIFNTNTNFSEQMEMILEEFKILSPVVNLSISKLINKLKKFAEFKAKKNKNVAIIVDEAQNLDYDALESWRLLSNYETESGKLIQIVFSGQPEFEKKLKEHRLRQLAQRLSHRQYIRELTKDETFNFVRHRLKIAGGDKNIFNRNSLELIWKYSGGIPRKINTLCDNSLLIGYALEKKKITREITREAIEDLTGSPLKNPVHEFSNKKKFSVSIAANPPVVPNSPVSDVGAKTAVNTSRIALAAGLFTCIVIAVGIYFHMAF